MASIRLLSFLLASALLSSVGGVWAQNASISWIERPTEWQEESLMHLQISAPESQDAAQLTYDIYPLTIGAGSNQTEEERNSIRIRGMLVYADDGETLRDPDTIVFLNCDLPESTEVVGDLTRNKPRAILLYSLKGNCCLLQGSYINYTSIFTMANTVDTWAAMNNTRFAGAQARATITGNTNTTGVEPGAPERSGNNSAVAMSILYSITGLITLLFLVIIATGAIRAHRYPERYGPRSGSGGRTGQSRAKGLARAVLETLPIVKFGDPASGKSDPALELESQISRSSPEPGIGTRLSAIPEEPKTPKTPKTPAMKRLSEAVPMSGAVPAPETTPPVASEGGALGAINGGSIGGKSDVGRISEEHLGCSICTEDFTVGEDVRVLPCNHKFHPPCIDPWLINVSGTCPLCRLDLRPHSERSSANSDGLAPPLAGEWDDDTDHNTATHQRRRSYRLLDLHRLRNAASVEERIEILRRHRSQQQLRESAAAAASESRPTESEEQQRGRRVKLADRLKDKFRVRTRTQESPSPPTTTAAGPMAASEA